MATLRSKSVISAELIATLTKLPRLQAQLRELSQDVSSGLPDSLEQTRTQEFLTAAPSDDLPSSRALTVGDGLTVTDGGPGSGFEIGLDAFLATLAVLTGSGLIVRDGATAHLRSIEGTSPRISVTDGDGAAGNPSIDVVEASLNLANMGGTLGVDHGGTGVTVYSAFSAHNNGTAQAIPNGAWTQLAMSTEAFNLNGNFTSGAWTPPAGRPVVLTASALLAMGASGEVNIAIFKNGVQYRRGNNQTGAGNVLLHLSCIDVPNGTDVYTARVFQNSGVSQNTNGVETVTYFQGAML